MFNNIGNKIKVLAVVICFVGVFASVVSACNIYEVNENTSEAFFVAIVGSVLSWVGSFFFYGFGQLIENSDATRENTEISRDKLEMFEYFIINSEKYSSADAEKTNRSAEDFDCDAIVNSISELNKSKKDGKITEDEYNQQLADLKSKYM